MSYSLLVSASRAPFTDTLPDEAPIVKTSLWSESSYEMESPSSTSVANAVKNGAESAVASSETVAV